MQSLSEHILEDAHERLTRHGGVDASNITVNVEDGEITLEGTVDQGYRKVVAVELSVIKVEVPELLTHFSDLPDPRKPRGVRHELCDIVTISILAVICGANTYGQIHQYALSQKEWLSSFLELHPIRCRFARLFRKLPAVLTLY